MLGPSGDCQSCVSGVSPGCRGRVSRNHSSIITTLDKYIIILLFKFADIQCQAASVSVLALKPSQCLASQRRLRRRHPFQEQSGSHGPTSVGTHMRGFLSWLFVFRNACTSGNITSTLAKIAMFVHRIWPPVPHLRSSAFCASTSIRSVQPMFASTKVARTKWPRSTGCGPRGNWSFQAQRKIHRWPSQEDPRRAGQFKVHRHHLPGQRKVHRHHLPGPPLRAETTKLSCR